MANGAVYISMTRRVDALISGTQAPQDLLARVLARVALARRRTARLRLAALSLGLLTTSLALIPAFSYTAHEFAASGFATYLSVLFSDSSVALSYWRELSLSLVESLPSVSLLILASLISVFLWSLRKAVRHARVAFATA